jgi:fimbrial chaperone protein
MRTLLWVLAAVATTASPASASNLQVHPLLATLDAAHRSASVTVRNAEDQPVTIHSYALDWRQAGGEDQYEDSDAVIVSPPVVTIAPHASQIVRVGLRRPSPGARAFRLMIEEVPDAAAQPGMVRVTLRLNLPLYANIAAGDAGDLHWGARRLSEGGWIISARNSGAGWVRADATLAEGATGIHFEDGFSFGTVLPGSVRRWALSNPDIRDRARLHLILESADDGTRAELPHPR